MGGVLRLTELVNTKLSNNLGVKEKYMAI